MQERQTKRIGVFTTEATALRAKAAAKYPPTAKELCRQLKRFAARIDATRALPNIAGAGGPLPKNNDGVVVGDDNSG